MAELSNALRQKLGTVQNGSQPHPDPDVLTAFVERALPAVERAQVLGHLSVCWECREVVALSLPEVPEPVTQPAFKPAQVSGWRRWFSPALGLAGLVTAMAVVALVVMQVPGKSDREKQSLRGQAAKAADQAAAKDQKNPAASEDSFSADRRERAFASNEADKLRAGSITGVAPKLAFPGKAAGSKRIAAGDQPLPETFSGKQDFVNTGLLEASTEKKVIEGSINANLVPPAPQPRQLKTETRFPVTQTEIMAFSDLPAAQPTSDSNVRMFTPPPRPEGSTWIGRLKKELGRVTMSAVSPPIKNSEIASSAMKFRAADLKEQHPAEVAAAPEKAEAEGLNRFDSLSHRTLFAPESASPESAAAWKVDRGKLVKSTKPAQWEEAYPGASFQFTFVSARGNEVWAGGTHASVLHSRDGGGSWEAPRLGESASGSIVSILFGGATIQVKTSDDQSWSSSDGGKTWTLTGSN